MAIEFQYNDIEWGYNDHTGDGIETSFTVGFPYLNKKSSQNGSNPKTLFVYFDGVLEPTSAWHVESAGNVIVFDVAPADQVHIEFRRDSGINDPAIQWQNLSPITKSNLQKDQDWDKYINQELYTKTIALVDDLNAIVAAFALDDLDDVSLLAAAEGEFLRKSAGDWVNVQIVEADISDLQNYAVVGHTHLEADITDLQAYLLDITAEPIGDLSDVIQTAAVDGELLRFDGSDWINNTWAEANIAAVGHTHTESDITDLTHAIIVEEEGSGVAGGPHSTLDFVGAGVTVTDAGSGTATITIPSGSGTAGDSGYVLFDDAGNEAVIADHASRTPNGDARGDSAVDLQTDRSGATKVAAADNSTIAGGESNETVKAYGSISGGNQATTRRFGEQAYGGGSAADAQKVANIATVRTSDATQTIMGHSSTNATWASTSLDAATIPFPSSGAYVLAFEGYVIGMRAEAGETDACCFKIEGAMKKDDGGTVAFIGNPKVSVVGRDVAQLDCDVVLAAADAGMNIRVTGIAAQEWTWTCEWEGPEMLVPAL